MSHEFDNAIGKSGADTPKVIGFCMPRYPRLRSSLIR